MNKVVVVTLYSLFVHLFFIYLWKMPRSGIGGSWGRFTFSFVRSCFQSGCTILKPYQRCKRVPVAPYPCQHVIVLPVFNFSYSSISELLSHYGFTCIPLMTNNGTYFSFIGHLCIFFYEMFVYIFTHLFQYICFEDFHSPWKCLCVFVKNQLRMCGSIFIFSILFHAFVYPYVNTILRLFQYL